eukprot:9482854-Pyramimonas_sp.AAC.1
MRNAVFAAGVRGHNVGDLQQPLGWALPRKGIQDSPKGDGPIVDPYTGESSTGLQGPRIVHSFAARVPSLSTAAAAASIPYLLPPPFEVGGFDACVPVPVLPSFPRLSVCLPPMNIRVRRRWPVERCSTGHVAPV